MPRRTRLLFFIVSAYILAAFSWWGYSLLRLNYAELDKERKAIETGAERLRIQMVDEVLEAWSIGLRPDDAKIRKWFSHENVKGNYLLHFTKKIKLGMSEEVLTEALNVNPNPIMYEKVDALIRRKTIQYVSEGLVFILLMVWGMVLLYRSIKKRWLLNAQQNNFLLAVTHELKTPVAGIKLMLQSMSRKGIAQEAKDEMVQGSLADVERLENLVENVLMATRIDGGAYHFQMEAVDLNGLVKTRVNAFVRSNAKQQKFETDFGESKPILADPFAIHIVLDNLLSNSVKYSPEAATITLKIFEFDDACHFVITDEGSPIPEGENKNVYKKFYRIGNEQTRNSKGTGLGLYIVKRVLEQHNASIQILNRTDKPGNIFELQFPLTK
ncbi:MAG: HAMP domain-containing histidine kinase [Flavobacteriaceae bacterium]|nr:HAMP domain-containing histidine kinase [Flavobacteriaceae bacterium]